MEKQTNRPQTIGQAIDELISALTDLDESERRTAIRAACEHLKIPLEGNVSSMRSPAGTPTEVTSTTSLPGSQAPPSQAVDIRSFKEQKDPSSAMEMAATVAYYLSELAPGAERKSEVEVDDMVKYFKQANFPLPKRPEFLLVNAKNAGYFESAGSGKYKLNTVGYNLVAHNLPRNQAGASGISRPKKRRNSKAKRGPKKKLSTRSKK